LIVHGFIGKLFKRERLSTDSCSERERKGDYMCRSIIHDTRERDSVIIDLLIDSMHAFIKERFLEYLYRI
jgi:hypothetical protein